VVENPSRNVLGRLLSSRGGLAGLVMLGFLVVVAVFAGFIAPYSPYAIVAQPYLPPSLAHPFGTDGLGRDVFSQMVYGTRLSLLVGFASALGITALGMLVGLVSGYVGSHVDEALMRIVDVLLVIPSLVFMIFMVAVLGPSFVTVLSVIIGFGWPPMARMIRSQTLSLKTRGFVESSIVSGAPTWYILFRTILPNLVSLVAANGVLAVIYAIVADASLAFLGLGSSGGYSWGTVLNNAEVEGAVYHNGLVWVSVPGVAIAFTGVAITLVARALADASGSSRVLGA
jgi:peptide/nickel transport system permease protein